ncbi:MAG: D-alanyl-D-alanine carboxypeptidase [Syntrophaceae bacterium]|nr:D-alanyl-D-alanine carboxypeptidase [Syntrophaceae bacterium]
MPYRRIIAVVIILLLLLIPPAAMAKAKKARVKAKPGPPAPILKSAVVVDYNTGATLFAENPDQMIPPASLTKIMTLYLTFEDIQQGRVRPADLVTVSGKAYATKGTTMFLEKGEKVPLIELIKGISVASANDAAQAVAEHLGAGSAADFVARMNGKARELGMTRTRFMNPHGLPAKGQLTTARDMMTLSRAYLNRFPECLTIHSMREYSYHNKTQRNRNRLLAHYPGADGIKTGFVCASGYNIIATAKRDNVRVMAVVLGARTPKLRVSETERLLDVGFEKANGGRKQAAVGEDIQPDRDGGSFSAADPSSLPAPLQAGRIHVLTPNLGSR